MDAVKSMKWENARLKNEISDLRIVVESVTVVLQEEKVKNNTKGCIIEELNEKVCRITEAKMRMISENDKSNEDLESRKRIAEDELLSRKEVDRETILNLEEAMSLQKQQHLSSTETPKRFLKSMDEKLSVREKELNDIQAKCV